jgi:hypothetical protein
MLTEKELYDLRSEYRFRAKYVVQDNGCWLWEAATNQPRDRPYPYGIFSYKGRQMLAHRWAYEHFRVPIPDGMVIDHLCKDTLCVNPDHLEVVTQRTNFLRGNAPNAIGARRDTCIYGHAYTPDNTKIKLKPDGRFEQRVCLICQRDQDKRRNPRRKKSKEGVKK